MLNVRKNVCTELLSILFVSLKSLKMGKNDNFDIFNIYQYNFKNLEKNYITINKKRRELLLRISLSAILYRISTL
jgi:hypothetical protein